MTEVEIKPDQYAVKGDKKYKVVAVKGENVTLYSPETHTEFESQASKLLASGYVLMDVEDVPEKATAGRSVAASIATASTLTVPAGEETTQAGQSPDLFPPASNEEAESLPPSSSTEASAGQRRVRTPEEIVSDLIRLQEEERAKMDLRYRGKIFKASQRLKSLPQKRSDALALLDGLRQTIRASAGDSFMTDDQADVFIRNTVESACLPVNIHLLNALRPFADGQDSAELRVAAIAAVSLADAH